MTRWIPSAALLVAGVALLTDDAGPVGIAGGVLLLLVAAGLSPLAFPRSQTDGEAIARGRATGVPVVYWRPGCSWCLRLRLGLGLAGRRVLWVDVSHDADASARVRSLNDGNETVPTVVLPDGSSRTNPPPSWVRARLAPTVTGSR